MAGIRQYDDEAGSEYGSKFPITSVTARIVTLVSLIVTIAVIKINHLTYDNGYVRTYKDFRSYRYMFYITIFGICYTLLQLPFAIYYMRKKKHLINNFAYLKFDFYADKIMGFLLATAAGAAFGATMDLKSNFIRWDEESKTEDFLTMAYIPSAFLLLGGIATGISSVHSSLALTKLD